MNMLFELDKLLYDVFQENSYVSVKDFKERLGVSEKVSRDIILILKAIGVVTIINENIIRINENYRCLIESLSE